MGRLIKWFNIIIKKQKGAKRWQKVVTVMAAMITFATTYALILPAITVEKNSTEEVGGMYLEQTAEQDELLEENALEPTGVSIAADMDNAVTFACANDDLTATAVFSTDEEIPGDAELVVNLVDPASEEYAALRGRSEGLLAKEFIYDVTTCTFYDYALVCDNVDVTPKTGMVDIQIIFRNNTNQHVNDVVYVGRFARPSEDSDGFAAMAVSTVEAGAEADDAVSVNGTAVNDNSAGESGNPSVGEDELVSLNIDESSAIELSDGIITSLSLKGSDLSRSDSLVGIIAGYVDEEIKAAAAETDAEVPEYDESQDEDTPRRSGEDASANADNNVSTSPEEDSSGTSAEDERKEITDALQMKTLKASGNDYTVILTYDETSGISEEAVLAVSEIAQGSKEYNTYLKETKKAMGLKEEETLPGFAARFFDIKIMVDGKEFNPESGVSVEITYAEPLAEYSDTEVNAVHFADEKAEAEMIEANTAEVQDDGKATVEFTAESFSVYGIIYTVDFHYEVNGKMYEYTLPGGGFVSFYKLVEVLGISNSGAQSGSGEKIAAENSEIEAGNGENTDGNAVHNEVEEAGVEDSSTYTDAISLNDVEVSEATKQFVADVASVEFSSPELVWVGKVDETTTVGGLKEANGLEVQYSADLTEEQIAEINGTVVESGDWALISVLPFDTEENLTVTMKNGEQFVVKVTDYQAAATDLSQFNTGNTYRFVIWGQGSDNQYYVLKTDGTTEAFDPNTIDTLGAEYLWTIEYGWNQGWDSNLNQNDLRYYIRPANDSTKCLALNGNYVAPENLVSSDSSGTRLYPPYSRHKNQQNNYYTDNNAGWIVEGWGWNRLNLGHDNHVFEGHSSYCSNINISRQETPSTYDIIVRTDDYDKGAVSGRDKGGTNRQAAESFTAITTNVSGVVKSNQYEIEAGPQTQQWMFDYWDLDGKTLYWDTAQSKIVFEENANTEVYTRLNGEGASIINPYSLPVSYNNQTLTAHFKYNPNYVVPDDDKDGRPFDPTIAEWLENLLSDDMEFPLNKAATQKTAEVYDYENRIYRVDIMAASNLIALDKTVKLGFILDVSGSMKFPSHLDMVSSTNNTQTTTEKASQLKLALNHINDNTNNRRNWLDQSKVYYMIADVEGTATVNRLFYDTGSSRWKFVDSSKSNDQATTITQSTVFHSSGDTGGNYPIYMAGDLITQADLNSPEGTLLRDLGLGVGQPKPRAFYLQRSMRETVAKLQEIMDKVTVSADSSQASQVQIAWNTFCKTVNGSDHVFKAPANVTFNYTYSGGTSTDRALNDALSFGWGHDSDTSRFAILITDGAPQRDGDYVPDADVSGYADSLKANGTPSNLSDDITLITLGLSMGEVRRGEILLYDIASKDHENKPYYYEAETGNELELALAEVIRLAMVNAVTVGNVTDTVNEAFYPVDKLTGYPLEDGYVINLNGEWIARKEDDLSPAQISAGYGVIHASNGTYSVTWTGQEFTWDGWHGTIYEKAKEDFLGGNAVRTNDPNHPAEVTSTDYKLHPGEDTIELNATTKAAGIKSLETPRVNVNELEITKNNTEWTVYLGTSVDPLEQIKALYNEVQIKQVILNGTDTDNDGFIDQASWGGEIGYPYYYDLVESASDARENETYGEQKFFYLKDLIKKLNGGNDIDWDRLITFSGETGVANTGITFPYDLYGQDNPGWITIKLEKDHDLVAHPTEQVGESVETYTLTVFFSPLYDHTPVGLGGDGLYPYHTGNFGLGTYGNAPGTEERVNKHTINVFVKRLEIVKADQGGNTITSDTATFLLYRKATEAECRNPSIMTTPVSGLPGEYVAVQTLNTNGGTVTSDVIQLLADNEQYYLVETKAPSGYIMLTEPLKVIIDTTGHNTWTKLADHTTSQVKPDPYVLSNWLQEATIKLLYLDDTTYDPSHTSTYDHTNDTTEASVTYKIINNAGIELPATGGPGTNLIYLFGTMLTGLAGTVLALRRKRRAA